jgi:ABC-2 type transport system ATP-binding protein
MEFDGLGNNLYQPALAFSGVDKAHGKVQALDKVELNVGPGRLVGLLGPNGAGKSTLLQLAAGLSSPDRGEVRVFGRTYHDDRSAILRQVGAVFQSRALDLEMTGRQNLRFHGGLFGLQGPELTLRVAEVSDLLGIGALIEAPVRNYSGGNQRRLEIARALLHRPRLLLLDEPTSGLDPKARLDLMLHLDHLQAQCGVAILWATHLVDEIERANEIVVMDQGKVVAAGEAQELMRMTSTSSLVLAYSSIVAGVMA